MVTIVRLGGAKIAMYARDHNPPHLHVLMAEYGCVLSLDTLEITAGFIPKQTYEVVRVWARDHMDELQSIWAKLNG
jgi:hypothetical protein